MNKPRFLFAAVLALGLMAAGGAPRLQEGSLTTEIALADLGLDAYHTLQGPFGDVTVTFQIPVGWQVQDPSTLNLKLQKFFSSLVPAQGDLSLEGLIAGNLSVSLDGNLVFRSVLSSNGEQDLAIPLSPALFSSASPQHELEIDWDASASCNLNLSTTILILPDSSLIFTHGAAPFAADLSQLPFPFFNSHSLENNGTLIVLPANANEAQLSAGLLAAASLGRLAPDSGIQLTTEDRLNNAVRSANHLVFVGAVEKFTSLAGLALPDSSSDQLGLPASNRPELGYVEVISSPWNPQLGLLIVSGTTDAAVQAAAVQVGGQLVLNSAGNLALVDISAGAQTAALQDTQAASFAQLGEQDVTFQHLGSSDMDIAFYVSPERAVSEQAYLDLRFAHSQLLDYLRSSLTLSLNSEPLSSLRLLDQSAARHSDVLLVSPAQLKPGLNHLQISANIVPLNSCASADDSNHWLTVYSDSNLSLPTADQAAPVNLRLRFDDFPTPFIQGGMRNTAFVVPADGPEYWTQAARLLRTLAAGYQLWPLVPEVHFVAASIDNLQDKDVILLGNFQDFLSDQNVGAAFGIQQGAANHGEISLGSGAVINYSPDVAVSFAGLNHIGSSQNAALAILGTSPAAAARVIDQLTAPDFARRYGNSVALVIQDQTLISDDGAATPAIIQPTLIAEQAGQPARPISNGKGWWLPALALLFVAAFTLVVWGELSAWIKKRKEK